MVFHVSKTLKCPQYGDFHGKKHGINNGISVEYECKCPVFSKIFFTFEW